MLEINLNPYPGSSARTKPEIDKSTPNNFLLVILRTYFSCLIILLTIFGNASTNLWGVTENSRSAPVCAGLRRSAPVCAGRQKIIFYQ